jgi:hypothetical protein
MSATRDKNQKTTFVYSNLYQLYKKGKEAAVQAEVPVAKAPVQSSQILKVENLNEPTFAKIKVSSYNPTEFIQKRVEPKPAILKVAEQTSFVRPMSVANEAPIAAAVENPVIDSLKQNLKSLNDLHSRLKFMLQELEELVKE